MYLPPLPSATLILSCTALRTLFYSLVPVLDCLAKQASTPPDSTALPALAVLLLSTCSPGPCRPLQPRATSPFIPYLTLSSCPPFADLGVIQAPLSTPVGYLFWFTSFIHHLSNPSPPSGLDRGPSPFRYQGGSCLQS